MDKSDAGYFSICVVSDAIHIPSIAEILSQAIRGTSRTSGVKPVDDIIEGRNSNGDARSLLASGLMWLIFYAEKTPFDDEKGWDEPARFIRSMVGDPHLAKDILGAGETYKTDHLQAYHAQGCGCREGNCGQHHPRLFPLRVSGAEDTCGKGASMFELRLVICGDKNAANAVELRAFGKNQAWHDLFDRPKYRLNA